MDVPGVQSAFKRPVSFPVFAQFKPPFMFGPLNEDPVDPGRVPGDICVNRFVHFFFGNGRFWIARFWESFSVGFTVNGYEPATK